LTVFSNSVLLGTSSFNWATEKRSHVVVELGAWQGPGFERGKGGGIWGLKLVAIFVPELSRPPISQVALVPH